MQIRVIKSILPLVLLGTLAPACLQAMPEDEKILRYIMDSRRKAPNFSFDFERDEKAIPVQNGHYDNCSVARSQVIARQQELAALPIPEVRSKGSMLFSGKNKQKLAKRYDVLSKWNSQTSRGGALQVDFYECALSYDGRFVSNILESHQGRQNTVTPTAFVKKPGEDFNYRGLADNTGITMSMRTAVLGEAFDKHQAFARRILQQLGTSIETGVGAAGEVVAILKMESTGMVTEIEFDPGSLIIWKYTESPKDPPSTGAGRRVVYECLKWETIDDLAYPTEVSMNVYQDGRLAESWTTRISNIVTQPLNVEFGLPIPEGLAVNEFAWPESLHR